MRIRMILLCVFYTCQFLVVESVTGEEQSVFKIFVPRKSSSCNECLLNISERRLKHCREYVGSDEMGIKLFKQTGDLLYDDCDDTGGSAIAVASGYGKILDKQEIQIISKQTPSQLVRKLDDLILRGIVVDAHVLIRTMGQRYALIHIDSVGYYSGA